MKKLVKWLKEKLGIRNPCNVVWEDRNGINCRCQITPDVRNCERTIRREMWKEPS